MTRLRTCDALFMPPGRVTVALRSSSRRAPMTRRLPHHGPDGPSSGWRPGTRSECCTAVEVPGDRTVGRRRPIRVSTGLPVPVRPTAALSAAGRWTTAGGSANATSAQWLAGARGKARVARRYAAPPVASRSRGDRLFRGLRLGEVHDAARAARAGAPAIYRPPLGCRALKPGSGPVGKPSAASDHSFLRRSRSRASASSNDPPCCNEVLSGPTEGRAR